MVEPKGHTVLFLSFRTDRSGQTVQTQIRLLLEGHTLESKGPTREREGHTLESEGHTLEGEGHTLESEGHTLE